MWNLTFFTYYKLRKDSKQSKILHRIFKANSLAIKMCLGNSLIFFYITVDGPVWITNDQINVNRTLWTTVNQSKAAHVSNIYNGKGYFVINIDAYLGNKCMTS